MDKRGALLDSELGRQAAISAGDAISTFIRLWWRGAETDDQVHSLAVASQGCSNAHYPQRFLTFKLSYVRCRSSACVVKRMQKGKKSGGKRFSTAFF